MMDIESKTDVEEKVATNGSEPTVDSLDELTHKKNDERENGAENSSMKKGKEVEMGEVKEVSGEEKDSEEKEEKYQKVGFTEDANLVHSKDNNDTEEHEKVEMRAAEFVHTIDGEGFLDKDNIAGEEDDKTQYFEHKNSGEKEIKEQAKEFISVEKVEGEKMESEETSVKDVELKKAFDSRDEEPGTEGKNEEEESEEEGKNEEGEVDEEQEEDESRLKKEVDEKDKTDYYEDDDEVKDEKKVSRKRRPRETKSREKGSEVKKRQMTTEFQHTPTSPSIERPVRERKTVERLVEIIEKGPSRDFLIEKGKGTVLKDIPNVSYKLSRRKPDDLRLVHAILFGRKGKATDFKNHILQFSGFVWRGDEDKQKSKVKEKLDKCVKEKLLDICDLFDLSVPRTTSKEDLVSTLLDFLISPHGTTDVILAEKEQLTSSKKRRRSRGSESRSAGSGSSSKHIKRSRVMGGDSLASLDKHTSEPEDESEDGKRDRGFENEHLKEREDMEHSESKDEKSEKDAKDASPKRKRQNDRRKPKSVKSAESIKSKLLTTPLKAHTPTPLKSSERSSSSKLSKSEENCFGGNFTSRKKITNGTPQNRPSRKHSSKEKDAGAKGKDETPTGKRTDSGPSKVELKLAICEILKEADFNTATFTDILRELAKHFDKDLTSRKSAIKLMIQDELTKLAEAEVDADDSQDDVEDESELVSTPAKKANRA